MRGVTEWHLGYPDSASRYMDQALAVARLLDNPFGLAFAHFGASLNQYRGDWLVASAAVAGVYNGQHQERG
jgi:hypothetical protein